MIADTRLRGYEQGDLGVLYALDRVCFEPPFRFSQAALRRFAEASNAIVRVAEQAADAEERPVLAGFCIVHLEPAPGGLAGYVVTLDVDPAWRGQGVARTLMGAVEQAARDAGASSMSLHVFRANRPAIQLYERLGYACAHSAVNFYGRGLDALVYQKALAEASQAGLGPGSQSSAEWRRFDGPEPDGS